MLTAGRNRALFGFALSLMLLFVCDGWLSSLLRALPLRGDPRRELELLQQYGGPASMVIGAAVIWLLDPLRRRRLADWILAAAVATLVASALKVIISRARPLHDDPYAFFGPFGAFAPDGIPGSEMWSMPSSHAAVAVVMSVFLSRMYPPLRPLAIAMATLVGVSRVMLGAHYPTDVVVGGLLGYLVAGRVIDGSWGTALLRSIPSSAAEIRGDLRHLLAVGRHTALLLLDHSQVSNTQRYGWHLCHLTYFRNGFKAHLQARPERSARWLQRQVFIDYSPDHQALERFAGDTVGGQYHRRLKEHLDAGYPDLRSLRLQCVPEEAVGLDPNRVAGTPDTDAYFECIVARRNLYSSAAHDYRHLILGADTSPVGEAVLGRYEYLHLREPEGLMTVVNVVTLLTLTGRWGELRRLRRALALIPGSHDPTELDIDAVWDRPLTDVRRILGLPPEGLMPAQS